MTSIGRVSDLWRYPIKSVGGERLERVHVDARGLDGDRLHGVYDADGKIGSGKNTRRFRRMDHLLEARAATVGDVLRITLPDGEPLQGLGPDIDAAFSRLVGQPVRVAREAAVSHFDSAPVHLVTEASLARARGLTACGTGGDARRFRPNIVLATNGAGGDEASWIGRRLRLGASIVLEPTMPTERCIMTEMAQSSLPRTQGLLAGFLREGKSCFGVYAKIVAGGELRVGDAVSLEHV